jgi:L-2,4-diaminobutyrate decarboxylase
MSAPIEFSPLHDPEIFRKAGHIIIDALSDYLKGVPSRDHLLRWREPGEALREFLEDVPREGVPAAQQAESLARLISSTFVEAGMHKHHPLYLGHQVAVPAVHAALADMAVSFVNPSQAVYEISPGANAIDAVLIRWLATLIGFDEKADGTIVSGGSVANLTALLAARNAFLGKDAFRGGVPGKELAILVSADHHYSISRAAMILGIGGDGVIPVPLDARRRMDPSRIADAAKRAEAAGRKPFALCLSDCSTPVGAFDPILASVLEARKLGLWIHIDAAHGGAALLSAAHRHRLEGIEQADSVTWDPHKMLFMPAGLGTVIFRRGQDLVGAFYQDAPYLFDVHHPELAQFDLAKKSIACTQRADCVKLWACLKVFGTKCFGELHDKCCDTAHRLYEKIAAAGDFEAIHEPESNIVCFRHVPERLWSAPEETIDRHNASLRAAVVRDGRAYLTPGHLDGRDVLRAVLMNPMTNAGHLDEFLGILRELAVRA